MSGAELDDLLVEVAEAVGLQEGDAGVRRVLTAAQELGNASTRAVSRRVGLPLPIVAAVNSELRRRHMLSTDRPSRLTERAAALLGAAVRAESFTDPLCDRCGGDGLRLPATLAGLPARVAALAEGAPAVDLTLDQSHCSVETKVRRVLLMLRYGLLPAHGLLLVGDDDLMSLAVGAVGAELGRQLVQRLAVVDVSAPVLDFILDRLTGLGVTVELVEQDLREPLKERLQGRFDVALTDPPYTVEGGRLFLSRAVEGLRPGPGRSVGFSFGAKGPDEALRMQEAVTELGLVVRAMHQDFNEYLGAGVIGSRSHLQVLSTTARTASVIPGDHAGPMYTAQKRAADRRYQCLDCGSKYLVGPGAQWHTVAELKNAGCLNCGNHRFRPLQLVRDTPHHA